jgi:regulator of sirC expression with transglutaminase-like and TPR domain
MTEQLAALGLVDEHEIELDRAALEIAALDHPHADLAAPLALIEQMAARLRAVARTPAEPAEQARALAQVLCIEFGFEGDRETYDDPANADLIRVLERRRGLPVALAILYVALGRRMGWSVHALNTPSHVLVAVGAPKSLVVDPFNGGRAVGPDQLAGLLQAALQGAEAGPEHLAPMPNRAVLVRLLMNQVSRAERAGRRSRALLLLERITTLAPAYTFAWWDRARLERALGDDGSARQSLVSMLETTRDPQVRAQVRKVLDSLAG